MKRKKFFTTGEVSELLDISRATVSRKFDSGYLTGKKNPITGDRLINYESLISFMKKYNISITDLESYVDSETDNKYILLASVDENILNLLKKTFSTDSRIQIEVVTSVYDALINCSKNPPDLFIIDEELPGISCKETVKSIKKNEELKDIKILLVIKEYDHNKILEIGADNYIAKDMLENITNERKEALIGYMFGNMAEDELSISKYEKKYNEIKTPESSTIFTSKLANDFNNTISSISGNISVLKNYLNNKNCLDIINDIELSCDYAKSLSYQLFNFFDTIYPRKNACEITSIIKEAVYFALKNSNIKYEFHFDNDLWLADIDKAMIILSLNNIIENAVEAMPSGGMIKVTVENLVVGPDDKTSITKGNYLKISISDNGDGIPKEYIPKIFDKYFTTKPNSSGLGLSTAHSIINRHDGYIFVESSLGKGTSFSILLNAITKDSIQSSEEIKVKKQTSLKILLMDDQIQICKTSERIFNYLNQKINTVNTGDDAVDSYKKAKNSNNPYDLVIMDLIVPTGIDGYEAARQIIEFDQNAVIIASTGNIFQLETMEKNYFKGILQKPYGIKEAKELINSISRFK